MLQPPSTPIKQTKSVKEKTSPSAHDRTSTLSSQCSPTSPKAKTTFLSLPSELRNQIYELALVRDRVIYIHRRKHHGQPVGWDPVSPTTNPRHITSINIEHDLSLGLLSICDAQIESEASSIFHGMNQFSIDVENVTDFFDETSIRHVRHLKITHSNVWQDAKGPFQKLEEWASVLRLQRLELSFNDFTNRGVLRNAGKINAKLLWPLVRALLETRGLEALNVIDFFLQTYRFGLNGRLAEDYYYGFSRNSAERHTKAVREELLEMWKYVTSKEEI